MSNDQYEVVNAAPRRKRGRPGKTSYGQIISAASEIVKINGVEALTMRAVGDRLGISAMSLYHYFPDRDTLVSATIQHILLARPKPELPEDPVDRAVAISHELVNIFDQFPCTSEILDAGDDIFRPLIWTIDIFVGALKEVGMDPREAYGLYMTILRMALGTGVVSRVRAGRERAEFTSSKSIDRGGAWFLRVTQQDCAEHPNVAEIISDIPDISMKLDFKDRIEEIIRCQITGHASKLHDDTRVESI